MTELILVSLGLGVGLTMDACAVSMTDGMNEPDMKLRKISAIAFTFAFFQALMPMIGWVCVSLVAAEFAAFARWIPYIALVLLVIVGGKMLFDGIKNKEEAVASGKITVKMLFVQAVATSIDALSTGFSLADIAGESWLKALISVLIIAAVTFAFCFGAVFLGKKFGNKLGGKAQILGGIILIAIGLEIFISGVFF